MQKISRHRCSVKGIISVSDEASFVSGAALPVDGAATA
jgi:hypothetical protein